MNITNNESTVKAFNVDSGPRISRLHFIFISHAVLEKN